jgi:hypothetical protein
MSLVLLLAVLVPALGVSSAKTIDVKCHDASRNRDVAAVVCLPEATPPGGKDSF